MASISPAYRPHQQTLNTLEGEITSTEYSYGYNDENYEYHIKLHDGVGIKLHFVYFDIDCGKDNGLYVREVNYDGLFLELCGNEIPEDIVVPSTDVRLKFRITQKDVSNFKMFKFKVKYKVLDHMQRNEITQSCEAGWTRFRNKCTKLFPQKVSRETAAKTCKESYASLLVPENEEEEAHFEGGEERWLGLTNKLLEDSAWTDDSGKKEA